MSERSNSVKSRGNPGCRRALYPAREVRERESRISVFRRSARSNLRFHDCRPYQESRRFNSSHITPRCPAGVLITHQQAGQGASAAAQGSEDNGGRHMTAAAYNGGRRDVRAEDKTRRHANTQPPTSSTPPRAPTPNRRPPTVLAPSILGGADASGHPPTARPSTPATTPLYPAVTWWLNVT